MTDVVEIAKNRRSRFAAEIGRLDEFLQTAELLIRFGDSAGGPIICRSGFETDAGSPGGTKETPVGDSGKLSTNAGHLADRTKKTPASISEASTMREVSSDDGGERGHDVDHFDFFNQASGDKGGLVLRDEDSDGDAEVDASIGQRLRQRRWMIGMTQKQLAERIGGDVAEIEKYERGHAPIGTGNMWKLAGALNVPVSYFFEKAEAQSADTGESRPTTPSPGPASKLAQTG